MDGIKEIITALQERIRTPVFGSIILATIAINWKAFYVLVFTKEYYSNKFDIIADHTHWWSLTIAPIFVGVAMVYFTPRIAHITAKYVAKPKLYKKLLEINQAHEVEKRKEENKAELEQIILGAKAKNAEIIALIEDEDLKLQAKKELQDNKNSSVLSRLEEVKTLGVEIDILKHERTKTHTKKLNERIEQEIIEMIQKRDILVEMLKVGDVS